MSEESPQSGAPKAVGGEFVLPAVAVAFTIYYFTTISEVPWIAQVSALLVGSVLILLCAIFAVRTVLSIRRGEARFGFGPLAAPAHYVGKRVALLALTIVYIFVIDWLGFTITSFLFLASAMLLLSGGRQRGRILLIAAALSLGGYLLFIVAFHTRFPAGPFENLMKALF
ncbi:MAG: tripartite tricarboxylate transporter TctB family protein [Alphaproteobacteria bacterium]